MLNQLSRCDTTIGPKARRTLRSAVRIATPAADGEPGCRPGMRMHLSIPLETREGPHVRVSSGNNPGPLLQIESSPCDWLKSSPLVSGVAASNATANATANAAANASELARHAHEESVESSPSCSRIFAWQSNDFSRIQSRKASWHFGTSPNTVPNHGSAYVNMCPSWPRHCSGFDLLACPSALHPRTRNDQGSVLGTGSPYCSLRIGSPVPQKGACRCLAWSRIACRLTTGLVNAVAEHVGWLLAEASSEPSLQCQAAVTHGHPAPQATCRATYLARGVGCGQAKASSPATFDACTGRNRGNGVVCGCVAPKRVAQSISPRQGPPPLFARQLLFGTREPPRCQHELPLAPALGAFFAAAGSACVEPSRIGEQLRSCNWLDGAALCVPEKMSVLSTQDTSESGQGATLPMSSISSKDSAVDVKARAVEAKAHC